MKIYGLGFWNAGQGAAVGFGNIGAWGSGVEGLGWVESLDKPPKAPRPHNP